MKTEAFNIELNIRFCSFKEYKIGKKINAKDIVGIDVDIIIINGYVNYVDASMKDKYFSYDAVSAQAPN